MKESWRNIIGCEGAYMVSSTGRIKSLSRIIKRKRYCFISERILRPSTSANGYLRIHIKSKINKMMTIHRLVAIAFLDNPYNKKQVNHKNGIKSDNRVENLEWCTSSENVKHSFLIGLKSAARGKNGAAKKVINIDSKIVYGCVTDAAIAINMERKTLSAMLNGTNKNKTRLKFLLSPK